MPRRARKDESTEQEEPREAQTSNIDDIWEEEIDETYIDRLEAQVQAEQDELEESRRAPEGDYLTITPYPVTRRQDDIVANDEEGNEVPMVRRRLSFWGDTIHEQTDTRYKLGFDVSLEPLYVIFNGAGNKPTYYTAKVKGARLDNAARNLNAAVKLFESERGRPPKRFSEIEEFLSETQLRLKVKKFSSGKSGVVAFDLPW